MATQTQTRLQYKNTCPMCGEHFRSLKAYHKHLYSRSITYKSRNQDQTFVESFCFSPDTLRARGWQQTANGYWYPV